MCTINVGTMIGRSREVVEMLSRRKGAICCVQEVQYRGAGCRLVGNGEDKFKLWWSGEEDRAGGVGILVEEQMVEDVIEVVRVSPRIMKVKIVLGQKVLHLFSVYAPQSGRPLEEKEQFWGLLDDEIGKVPVRDMLMIGGDLNGHIGTDREGFEEVMGWHGYGERNAEGERILECCQGRGLQVINTMFEKEDEKKVTYKSGGAATQIDFWLSGLSNISQ